MQRHHDFALRAHSFFDFENPGIEHLRQHDVPVEEPRAVLVGDAQRIAEAARDEQDGALAFALEQRVGGDGGAHLYRVDPARRDRLTFIQVEDLADPGEGRIAVAPGIFGQQLVGGDRAVRPAGNDVGEGPAAVDPELPAAGIAWRSHYNRILTWKA